MVMLVVIMRYVIVLCWPASQSASKMSYKKMLRIVRYCCWPYNRGWCGQHVSWVCTSGYSYTNLSSFLLTHPDLVLMVSPSCIIVLLSLITSVHVCPLLFLVLELCCTLSFASSFCFFYQIVPEYLLSVWWHMPLDFL